GAAGIDDHLALTGKRTRALSHRIEPFDPRLFHVTKVDRVVDVPLRIHVAPANRDGDRLHAVARGGHRRIGERWSGPAGASAKRIIIDRRRTTLEIPLAARSNAIRCRDRRCWTGRTIRRDPPEATRRWRRTGTCRLRAGKRLRDRSAHPVRSGHRPARSRRASARVAVAGCAVEYARRAGSLSGAE